MQKYARWVQSNGDNRQRPETMARSPANNALGAAESENISHGQDVQEDEDVYDEGEEEIIMMGDGAASAGDDPFIAMVAMLEEVMMDEGFNDTVGSFMNKHCQEFDDSEENKLIYTQLFADYTSMLEEYIARHISTRLPEFDMPAFCAALREVGASHAPGRQISAPPNAQRTPALTLSLTPLPSFQRADELPITHLDLDTLGAFGDFEAFKSMMLACKNGMACGDMSVMGAPLPVHADEQEDGVEMPDLNLSITACASPVKA